MATQPISWKQQFVVAVTRKSTRRAGTITRYFYGEKLAEAMRAARLKSGEGFAYARFLRGPVKWGEKTARKDCYIDFGRFRNRKKAA